jgi:response regulator RpfG family c-di-GMP phosphodiesterase
MSELPVIMVTGMDDIESINQAYESGANDFISKPINWPILGHRARYVLRSAQEARQLRELEEKQAAIVRAMPDMIFLMDRYGTTSTTRQVSAPSPMSRRTSFSAASCRKSCPATLPKSFCLASSAPASTATCSPWCTS